MPGEAVKVDDAFRHVIESEKSSTSVIRAAADALHRLLTPAVPFVFAIFDQSDSFQ